MKNEKKKITILEIFLLVVAIFAFSWMINTEVEVVSATAGGLDIGLSSGGVQSLITGTETITAITPSASGFGSTIIGSEGVVSGLGAGATTLASAVLWAAVAVLAVYALSELFASQRNAGDLTNVAIAAAVGVVGTLIVIAAFTSTVPIAGWVVAVIILAVTAVFAVFSVQDYAKHVFTFYPSMWQAPTDNYNCAQCNRLQLAGEVICSEYTCHSYGAACEWINDESQYETCVEIGQGDQTPPVINPLIEVYGEPVFPNDLFRYTSNTAGVKIVYDHPDSQGCVPAFTTIKIALETDEKAHCKYSIDRPNPELTSEEIFASMKNMNEGAVFTNNHTADLPSLLTASVNSQQAAGYTITNGGIYEFFVRCKDATKNGNMNEIDYSVGFCVHTGPDLMPPEITGTNPEEDSYIRYGIENIEQFQVYTNEPATCKWDFENKKFEFMSNDFDSCSRNVDHPIRGYEYGCEGTLTGFTPEEENTYYIACTDQPELVGTAKEDQRNTGEPVSIVLKGSKELIIQNVRINEQENNSVIKDGIENVRATLSVNTFGGADEGKARCKNSNTGTNENDYAYFFNDGNPGYMTTNTQEISLLEGNHKYFIKCEDEAGNTATSMVNFSVEVDKIPPMIIRIYKQGNQLKLITDEISECYYATFDCIYDIDTDGTKMSTGDGKAHAVEWDIESDLHIKCKDMYGGRPDLDKCSIIARPFEVHEVQDLNL
jgi:hypothetical protein